MKKSHSTSCTTVDISESDVIAAMKEIQGYLDISPGDFREVFRIAYTHALERIRKSRRARDIMTFPAFCLRDDMDLVQAAQCLADKHFSGAPVVDETGKIVGVLSEKDFLARMGIGKAVSFMEIVAHCLRNKGCLASTLRNHSVREIMSAPPVTAVPDITVDSISALFMEKQINRVPIIDDEKRPVGIVTRTNLVSTYCVPEEGRA